MPISVAFCDDELIFLKSIEEKVNKIFISRNEIVQSFKFLSADELLKTHNQAPFDIIFLDIDMPLMSGFEAAKVIHEKTANTAIVFVSCKNDLVYQSLTFRPFRFIRKELIVEEIGEAVDAFIKDWTDRNEVYVFSIRKSEVMLKVCNIIYFEKLGNNLIIHTRDGKCYSSRQSISKFVSEFYKHDFSYINSCYLVNMNFIGNIEKEDVILTDGTVLKMSRGKRKEVLKQYLKKARALK